MGVKRYKSRGQTFWMIDAWIKLPNGSRRRWEKRRIPTKEQAKTLLRDVEAEAFKGRWLPDLIRQPKLTVEQAWKHYEPISKRDNDSWRGDRSYSKHLLRHLSDKQVHLLTEDEVDTYRNARLEETSKRKKAPSKATIDREVELLKRMLNYAVRCHRLKANPIAGVKLLLQSKDNVRRTVLDEAKFAALAEAAAEPLKTILLIAFDMGMRKMEILNLRWDQIKRDGTKKKAIRCIELAPDETKEEDHRRLFPSDRVKAALEKLPRHLHSEYLFVNHRTSKPYRDIRKLFKKACDAAEIPCGGEDGLWFYDLRRSFVTKARRAGIPESVVMRMSGHHTREVFERYNIKCDKDLQAAVKQLELARVAESGVGGKQEEVSSEPLVATQSLSQN